MKQNRPEDSGRRKLSASFSKRLKAYAAAAGLGAFGFTQASEATIVFTDIPDVSGGIPSTTYVNLDNAGYNEFAIAAITYANQIRFNPYNIGGQASQVLTSSGSYYVFSFAPGAAIGPAASAAGGARIGFRTAPAYPGSYYNFVGTGNYIGLKWDIGGGDYRYGWARVDVTEDSGGTMTLYSYAYESEANVPIEAGAVPEPTSLALLAAGAGALGLARRRRR